MALRTRVKLNNVTNLHDARYGAGMAVDFLGIAWHESSMYVKEHHKLDELIKWIVGVEFIAELDSHLLPIPDRYKSLFSYIQTKEEAKLQEIISQYRQPIILEKEVRLPAHCEYLAEIPLDNVDMIILKATAPDWTDEWSQSVTNLSLIIPTLLDFEYDAEQIKHIADQIPTIGFALQGSPEIITGINDMDKLTQILEILELP